MSNNRGDYCKCQKVFGINCVKKEDGRYIHFDCNKYLSDEIAYSMDEFYKNNPALNWQIK